MIDVTLNPNGTPATLNNYQNSVNLPNYSQFLNLNLNLFQPFTFNLFENFDDYFNEWKKRLKYSTFPLINNPLTIDLPSPQIEQPNNLILQKRPFTGNTTSISNTVPVGNLPTNLNLQLDTTSIDKGNTGGKQPTYDQAAYDRLTGAGMDYGLLALATGVDALGQTLMAMGGNVGEAGLKIASGAFRSIDNIKNLREIHKLQALGAEGLGMALAGNIAALAGTASDIIGSFMPEKTEYSGTRGNVTLTMDSVYDGISDAAMAFGPVGMLVGGAMKGASLLGKGFGAIGGGTDGMTNTDAILGSSFFNWNIGLINGFGGSRADTLAKDEDAFANVGSSYTGSNYAIDQALIKSGKKYGLLSGGARDRANREIRNARALQNIISDISNEALDRFAIRSSMSAINANRRENQLMGYLNSIRIGKNGLDFKSIKLAKQVAEKYKGSKEIVESFYIGEVTSLDPVYKLKNGGLLEISLDSISSEFKDASILELDISSISKEFFEPSLLEIQLESVLPEFKDGGTIEKPKPKYSKPTYEEWVKTVPKSRLNDNYDLESAYKYLPFHELESWRTATNKELNSGNKHLSSCVEIEDGVIMFLKKGLEDPNKPDYNPEVHFELDLWYDPNEHGWYDYGRLHYDLVYKDGRYWYVPKEISSEFTGTRTLDELILYAKELNPRFILRMSEPVRDIEFTDREGNLARGTHYMATEYDGENWYVFPQIFEDESGNLIYEPDVWKALEINKAKGNVLKFNTKEEALLFSESPDPEHGYKKGWPEFFKQYYKEGGKFNVIPEGALHARLHHMENAENLTKKGIPVVSENKDGELEQQAEIECEEIIFRLEVTKKLEELAKENTDKAAIEAGKLLVEEILNNTIDNTNKLI